MTSILKSPVGLIGLPFLLFFVGADAFATALIKIPNSFYCQTKACSKALR